MVMSLECCKGLNHYSTTNLIRNGDLSTIYNDSNQDLFTTAEHTSRQIADNKMSLLVNGNATKYVRSFNVGQAKTLTMLAVVSSADGTQISAGLTGTSDVQFPKIYSSFSVPAGGEPYIITMTSPVIDKSKPAGISLSNDTANNYQLHYISCVGGNRPLLDDKATLKIEHHAQATINQTRANTPYVLKLSNDQVTTTSRVLNCFLGNSAGLDVTMSVVPKQGELVFIFTSADGQPFNLGYIPIRAILEV